MTGVGPLRWGLRLAIILAGLVAVGELIARVFLGLGDPPLSIADPNIEYLFKPSMDYRRFGNRVAYNAYSMRSDNFSPSKSTRSELRVLVMGDSVVNGGSLTDQSQLGSELLKAKLSDQLDRPIVVGNISAGSWGPANLLAYARRFGWFEADIVAIVLSSHDYADEPTYDPVVGRSVNFPNQRPLLAIQEWFTRYLPRYFPWRHRKAAKSPDPEPPSAQTINATAAALGDLIRSAQASGAHVVIAQHLETSEIQGVPDPGHAAIGRIARQMGVTVVQLGPAMAKSMDRGKNPYKDKIHPNAQGQKVICDVLFDAIKVEVTTPNG